MTAHKSVKPLSYEEASFDFDLKLIAEYKKQCINERIIGQPRAIRALQLGLSLEKSGYNVFVSGDSGSGRHNAVRHTIESIRNDVSKLKDIVYVYNFLQPDSPKVLTFEAGTGQRFSDAMLTFNQKIVALAKHTDTFLQEALKLLELLQHEFSLYLEVVDFFVHLRVDLIRQAEHIKHVESKNLKDDPIATRYQANLLVNHAHSTARPLIIEPHPSFTNLFGSIDSLEKSPHLSLHAGSLVEASGGFIVIDADELISETGLWDALKRYLDANTLVLESTTPSKGEIRSPIRPQIVPLPVKVILIGSEDTYDILSEGDERFLTLFKICAQFDYSMPLQEKTIIQSIANLKSYAKERGLFELTDSAYAQLLRYSCWYVESRTHLSTHFSSLYDLIEEAQWWAQHNQKQIIDGEMILTVNEERSYANSISESKINEEILNGEMIISLEGSKIGVVNALAVMDRGSASFGTPTVISCTVAPGNEGIVNIEHEAGLSGEIHDKGLLILEGYLRKHYARNFVLSIYAGIAFEQSYAEVDGDSASSSELYALLSAIGELPIRQDIAVTGSVNQMGLIQPVGGINEKIEGFFRTCQTTGLTGKQGVIIPIQNVRNLILSYEVLDAIKENKFFIYPIKHIDEGMRLLTGRPCGVRNAKGNYSAGNFNYDIEERLKRMYLAVSSNRN
jgi:predicted ATP-dependent protease